MTTLTSGTGCWTRQPHIQPSVQCTSLLRVTASRLLLHLLEDLFGADDIQYRVHWNIINWVYWFSANTPIKTSFLTPDRCRTAPHTQFLVGRLCRTRTDWVQNPNSPHRRVGDKRAPLPLWTRWRTELAEHFLSLMSGFFVGAIYI